MLFVDDVVECCCCYIYIIVELGGHWPACFLLRFTMLLEHNLNFSVRKPSAADLGRLLLLPFLSIKTFFGAFSFLKKSLIFIFFESLSVAGCCWLLLAAADCCHVAPVSFGKNIFRWFFIFH